MPVPVRPAYGDEGGIGSASRVITIGEKEYTIGVLVQSNFGATEDFVLNGEAVGPKILEWKQERVIWLHLKKIKVLL